mmetsp:Transcript_12102/g.34019  ORF Transcript_12102/g.34019 Transcript_12102/m.34019 type:complete len:105 (-) Transcript_12102:160-474(-)
MADDEPVVNKRAEQRELDAITDHHEERELNQSKVQNAMRDIAESQKADKEAQQKREKELAAVKVNKADIDVIAKEFEIDSKKAERRLRECGGDLAQSLKSLLQA